MTLSILTWPFSEAMAATDDAISSASQNTQTKLTPPPEVVKTRNPMEAARPLRPGPPRYLENYSFLVDDTQHTDTFDTLRHIPIGDTSWLSIGGGLRYRYEDLNRPGFGLKGVESDQYWQQRLQLHFDLHLFDDAMRAFLEINNTDSWSKEVFSPNDRSDTEIHQAFVDARWPVSSGSSLVTRFGRQEMGFGDLALIDVRNTPNVRLAFDGARLTWKGHNGISVDGFVTRPVGNVRTGSFNDSSTDSGEFYGLYATAELNTSLSQDLYALGFDRDDRALNGVTADESRYTLGTRFFGKQDSLDYSWNLMYQFGDRDSQDIQAWGLMSTTGYTFANQPGRPRLGLVLDAASGDDSANDGNSNTFDPLFAANGKFFGNAGVTTLSNLIAVGPELTVKPWDNITLTSTALALWRESEDDAAYVPGMQIVAGTAGVSGRELGQTYNLLTRWTPTNNLTVDLEYQYYDVGDVIQRAGGKDTQYVSVRTYFFF